MKRITISMSDDLRAMVGAHAVASGLSLSAAVGDLLRRASGLDRGRPTRKGGARVSRLTGLRVSAGDRMIRSDDVQRALDAEDGAVKEHVVGRPSGTP